MAKDQNIKERQCYAVQTGDYVGQMFIICEVDTENIGCLAVPAMENVKVPIDKWTFGRNSDIIEYVEDIPRDTFEVITAQYDHNENADN